MLDDIKPAINYEKNFIHKTLIAYHTSINLRILLLRGTV